MGERKREERKRGEKGKEEKIGEKRRGEQEGNRERRGRRLVESKHTDENVCTTLLAANVALE